LIVFRVFQAQLETIPIHFLGIEKKGKGKSTLGKIAKILEVGNRRS